MIDKKIQRKLEKYKKTVVVTKYEDLLNIYSYKIINMTIQDIIFTTIIIVYFIFVIYILIIYE